MRTLAVFSLALSSAVFVANYLLPVSCLLPLTAAFALAAAALFFTGRKWLRAAVLVFSGLAAGLGVFAVKYYAVTVPCRALDGEKLLLHAYLTDYPKIYDGYCSGEIQISDRALPNVRAVIYDSSGALAAASPGDEIEALVRLRCADMRYGREYDRYNARDIFLTANAAQLSLSGRVSNRPSVLLAKMRQKMSARVSALYPEREAAFLRALMLGDKQGLYSDTELYSELSDAGIMHIAAVSGMHIAFLVSVLIFLFGAGKVGALISIALVWVFAVLTGASPSAVRAGFMQSVLLFAPVVRRENDPVTSLSAVLALVLIKNPYAAASLSLQLSFGAMAGIMLFADRIYIALSENRGRRAKRILKKPLAIISGSLSVMVFTVPLTAVHFGCVNVLSPLTNILTMLAVSVCFCGGFLSLALSALWLPLGKCAAWVITVLVRYIIAVVKAIASLGFCTVYLTEAQMKLWLIAAGLILVIVLTSKFSDRMKLLLSASFIIVLLFSALLITERSYSKDKCSFAVVDVGQGQSIVLLSGDKTVAVDCGGGGKDENAGQLTAAHLLSRGRRRLDALILTHLHSDHANGVTELMEKVETDRIIMPRDTESGGELLASILAFAGKKGTEIQYIDSDCVLEIGEIRCELFAPGEAGGANERCLTCRIGAYGHNMLITADAPISAENELADNHDLSGTDYLIAGHHGSRYSSGGKLLKEAGADTAIISVGYNSYGHPQDETLVRFASYGYNVFRTDRNGTVEIRIR